MGSFCVIQSVQLLQTESFIFLNFQLFPKLINFKKASQLVFFKNSKKLSRITIKLKDLFF